MSKTSGYNFLICRNRNNDSYQLYQVDPNAKELFAPVSLASDASFDHTYRIAQIGGYLLQWGPICKNETDSSKSTYQFNLIEFDPESTNPLNAFPLQSGSWQKEKFWGYRDQYSTNPNEDQCLDLIPMGSFILSMIPAKGRGTFDLWNFDPQPNSHGSSSGSADPIPSTLYTSQGGFALIKDGHTLIPIGNYVLDRSADRKYFRVWSFDPAMYPPLALPAIREGRLEHIHEDHELTAIGDYVLEWHAEKGTYWLWKFDPEDENVLIDTGCKGKLPSAIGKGSMLTGYQPRIPLQKTQAEEPGTIDFMRSKVKHVVYYMLESRSFDNVCGWLYENSDKDCHYIGTRGPFDGASTEYFNYSGSEKVHVSKYKDGKLSNDWPLEVVDQDPFHDTTDCLQQMFVDPSGYWNRDTPDMGGFILNSTSSQVMETLSPEQLPVLNGLASNFAISDRWFCSVPGGTDINRGFSVSGSGYNKLGTWEGGYPYKIWPYEPQRQSIWKVLWSQGITDWKIYNAILWSDQVFTYQLYLKGQIPSIDEMVTKADNKAVEASFEQAFGKSTDKAFDKAFQKEFEQIVDPIGIPSSQPTGEQPNPYLASVEQFMLDAASGELPAFSLIEPAWVGDSSTSYHPGGDLVPAETELNKIYEAIKNGPGWEETLLVITFDKNNGLYDHVSPPYAKKPWPNDMNNGFGFDIMGARVPTIMVSPWIKEHSVIRAEGDVPFDSTSFTATLLNWFGIPKPLWGLGDRMDVAPTFEKVFQESEPRASTPSFTPPYDKNFPKKDKKVE